jgi:hypothetical protein
MALTSRTTPTKRRQLLRSESGTLLVEALVAAAILLGGGAATIVAYDSTTRASHTSEREAEAVSLAEKELERIVSKPYAQINDCSAPAAGTGRTDDPQSWVQNGSFFVPRNFRPAGGYSTPPPVNLNGSNRLAVEPFSVSNTAGCVLPEEDASSTGVQSTSKINHTKIFRFITYQGSQCSSSLSSNINASLASTSLLGTVQTTLTNTATADVGTLCGAMATQQAKRVTVAIVLNQVANGAGLKYPVYVSTLVTNPNASLHAATGTVLG